jgi:hypothetical protein
MGVYRCKMQYAEIFDKLSIEEVQVLQFLSQVVVRTTRRYSIPYTAAHSWSDNTDNTLGKQDSDRVNSGSQVQRM